MKIQAPKMNIVTGRIITDKARLENQSPPNTLAFIAKAGVEPRLFLTSG